MEAATMRNLVGVLAFVITLLLLTPSFTLAEQANDLKKFSVELKFGGGYYAMQDVNDYLPETEFLNYPGSDEDDILVEGQFGFGFAYRNMHNFGWVFGYNFLSTGIMPDYRRNAFYPQAQGAESWVEQKVSGSEFYIMPTWYWGWGNKEISFSAGPAVYSATLDRTISIVRNAGSGANSAGSFNDATGKSLGLLVNVGLEFPTWKSTNFFVNGGFRLANVGELIYKDASDIDQTVWMNTNSNSKFSVDFTGAFLGVGLRWYYAPSTEWRNLE